MSDNPKELLIRLAVKVKDLIRMCDVLKNEKTALQELVNEKDKEIAILENELNRVDIKYKNLKTANALTFSEGEKKEAKVRFNKLVREIDKCISLLNE